MSRLTERKEDGSYDLTKCSDCKTFNCIFCSFLTKSIQKLGKLEDIEHGILKKVRDFGK